MAKIDNSEAYDAISWILGNADMGFFIVTASPHMQRKVAELYETNRVSIYDYLPESRSYSYPELSDWSDRHQDKDVFFILNMQRAIADEKGSISEEKMLLFNMSRDVLADKRKVWLFFMTEEAENRLSTFAYDIYSYVRQKVRFKNEEESDFEGRQLLDFEERHNYFQIKETLARYKELEERYLALSLDDTPEEQLLSSAFTLMNIATLYRDCADYENAHRLLERIRIIREKVLGKEHPSTATTYNNIAGVYDRQGDYSKALEWYIKSYKIVFYKLGAEHPSTDIVRENMETAFQNTDISEPFEKWLQKRLDA